MTSYKETQKELKKPDEFQRFGQSVLPWFERNARFLVFGAVGVIAGGGVVALVTHLRERAEERASHQFATALALLSRPVSAETTPPAAGEEPPFQTEAAKDDALVKSLSDFRKDNAGKRAAHTAALPMAQTLLRLGKPAEALPLVEEFLGATDPNDPLRAAAHEARGYALEAQKKYDEALAAFDELARENKTDFLQGMGQFHRARLLQLRGDAMGAAKEFAAVETAHPNSAAARMAKERTALLAAQGIVAPRPPPAGGDVDAGSSAPGASAP